ncbi:MAG: hypothetical protein AAGF01_03480 [Cyanobacteria bacterium P01_G01_bin.38]
MNLDFLSGLDLGPDFNAESLDASPLDVIELFSSDLAEEVEEIAISLGGLQGSLEIDEGTVTGSLSDPATRQTFTVDAFDFIGLVNDLFNQANDASGEATLEGGIFSGNLTLGGETTSGAFEVGALLEDTVSSFVAGLDVEIPFQNGAFDVDVSTVLGDFVGTIDFAGGDLDVDVLTPFGQLVTSFDFPDNAIINLEPGMVDFNTGFVEVPLLPGTAPVSLALDALSGVLGLGGEVATLTIDTAIGPVSAGFAIDPLIGEVLEFIDEDVTGEFAFGEGEASALVDTPFGVFEGTLPILETVEFALNLLSQSEGSLALGDGSASLALDGALTVDTTLAVAGVGDLLSTPISEFF